MPKQFILNSICITLFGTFVGYSVTHLMTHPTLNTDQTSLEMSSLATDSNSLNEHTLTKLASQQIYQDYFDVRIKHDIISKTAEGHSIVKAIVTAKKDLPAGLEFKWKLGEDMTASAENLKGQLAAIKQGEKQEIFLTVYGFNKHSKKYLSFLINGILDNHTVSKEILSSSRPEDSFEYIVQQANQMDLEQRSIAGKTNGKITTKSSLNRKFSLENIVK